jgi:hypothetical protein
MSRAHVYLLAATRLAAAWAAHSHIPLYSEPVYIWWTPNGQLVYAYGQSARMLNWRGLGTQ